MSRGVKIERLSRIFHIGSPSSRHRIARPRAAADLLDLALAEHIVELERRLVGAIGGNRVVGQS
jgi:hypothetical protein